ncbi:hypothetical protein [Brachyspira catarrhinii]|uniref:Uncharacterized protein n=1 Tax=Brachyspira catarrhinii TaxID=2528966 RepID=A0ABY2TPT9_9SPIR|nr:hypothetical protein [Brachyspira catarrhinii]TKZ34162.1 hypothetical protein EZH24_08105 [Brachyspira catarrhinii]
MNIITKIIDVISGIIDNFADIFSGVPFISNIIDKIGNIPFFIICMIVSIFIVKKIILGAGLALDIGEGYEEILNNTLEKIELDKYKIKYYIKNNLLIIRYKDKNLYDKFWTEEIKFREILSNILIVTNNKKVIKSLKEKTDLTEKEIKEWAKEYLENEKISTTTKPRRKRNTKKTTSQNYTRPNYTTPTTTKPTVLEIIHLRDNLEKDIFNDIVEKMELLNKYKIKCNLNSTANSISIEYNDIKQIGKFLLEKGILDEKQLYDYKGNLRNSDIPYTRNNIPFISMNGIIDYSRDTIHRYLTLPLSYKYMINYLIMHILSEHKKVKDKNEMKIREEKRIKEENERRIREEIKRKEENKKLQIILNKCEAKIEEIKEIIKDFNYSDKKTYEKPCSEYKKSCSKIKKDLENTNIKKDQAINNINNLIDEINQIYKNAYNKKNNVSSLSYIMETDEDIDLIEKIDIKLFNN